jgi:hypothetical protein
MSTLISDLTTTSSSKGIEIVAPGTTPLTADQVDAKDLIEKLDSADTAKLMLLVDPSSLGYTPKTVAHFFNLFKLDSSARQLLAAAVNTKATKTIVDENDVIEKLSNSATVRKHFQTTKIAIAPRPLKVNPNIGLNLLLVNPQVATAINAERVRRSKLIMARPIRNPGMGPFGALLPGSGLTVSIRQRGGAAMEPPSFNYPIEMRGGGYDIAMAGGAGALGWWSPPNDDFFISAQIKSALETLRATLKAKGNKDLAQDVDAKVTGLVQALETAEENIRIERNNLKRATDAITSGNADPTDEDSKGVKTGVLHATLTSIAGKYNTAVSNARSIENKLFRVIVALNGVPLN